MSGVEDVLPSSDDLGISDSDRREDFLAQLLGLLSGARGGSITLVVQSDIIIMHGH